MIFIKNKKQKNSYSSSNDEIEDRINRYKKSTYRKKINARFFQRFSLLDDNVTILYNNDILRIHDISYNGFSVKINPHSLKNFIIGKTYCFKKFKLFQKETTVYGKVVWISEENNEIGFSLEDGSNSSSKYLIEQLLLPWEISSSLKPVNLVEYDTAYNNKNPGFKTMVYKGLLNTEVCIVLNKEEKLEYFQVFSNNFYMQWKDSELSTGSFSYKPQNSSSDKPSKAQKYDNIIYMNNNYNGADHDDSNKDSSIPINQNIPFLLSSGNLVLTKDRTVNNIHKLFLYTIIKKSSIPNKDLILNVLELLDNE